MWRKQPPRAKVPLGKAMGRRLGVEARMAQRGGKNNKGRSVGEEV